jgi:hypothetical protein
MGIFYGVMSTSAVVGGLVAAFLLNLIPTWVVILILALACFCGMIPLLFLEDMKYIDPLAAIESPDAHSITSDDYRPSIKRLLPLFGYTGVFIGFAVGIFPTFIGETVDSDLLVKVILTTTFLSFGQGAGGIIWA